MHIGMHTHTPTHTSGHMWGHTIMYAELQFASFNYMKQVVIVFN